MWHLPVILVAPERNNGHKASPRVCASPFKRVFQLLCLDSCHCQMSAHASATLQRAATPLCWPGSECRLVDLRKAHGKGRGAREKRVVARGCVSEEGICNGGVGVIACRLPLTP